MSRLVLFFCLAPDCVKLGIVKVVMFPAFCSPRMTQTWGEKRKASNFIGIQFGYVALGCVAERYVLRQSQVTKLGFSTIRHKTSSVSADHIARACTCCSCGFSVLMEKGRPSLSDWLFKMEGCAGRLCYWFFFMHILRRPITSFCIG